MILTGRSWSGLQALHQGLVARIAPESSLDAAVEALLVESFLPRSAAVLRQTTRVVRSAVVQALYEELPKLERYYLEELMREPDAEEGIRAFLERRNPHWHRTGALM
jgi:enoyl-CoA hydratase/carnithine racemase